jgi:hypothetical protein
MAMAPLPAPELADGTVTVRVARRSLATPAIGVEVIATVVTGKGKPEIRKTKTGADGRATFEKVAADANFQANVTVDGEKLSTAEFPMPGKGGVRFLLIAGEESEEEADPHAAMAADPHAGMANPPGAPGATEAPAIPGVRGGKVSPKEGTPPGRLVLRILGQDGSPIAKQLVRIGKSNRATKDVEFLTATSDENGVATWEKLQPGKTIDYVALIERDGIRVGTDAFAVDEQAGLEGELRMPGRTSDTRVLRVSSSSRMMIEPREDSLSILQNLVIENTSDKLFEPDAKGVFLPLPAGFTGAEKLPGGVNLDLLDGQGAIMRIPVSPSTSNAFVAQARMGFVLDSKNKDVMEIVQPMPFGLAGGMLMVPGQFPLTLSAPGLREKPAEKDDSGAILRVFELDAIAPGAALRLTISGLPKRPVAGKLIAGGISLLLVAAGILGALRGKRSSTSAAAKA